MYKKCKCTSERQEASQADSWHFQHRLQFRIILEGESINISLNSTLRGNGCARKYPKENLTKLEVLALVSIGGKTLLAVSYQLFPLTGYVAHFFFILTKCLLCSPHVSKAEDPWRRENTATTTLSTSCVPDGFPVDGTLMQSASSYTDVPFMVDGHLGMTVNSKYFPV